MAPWLIDFLLCGLASLLFLSLAFVIAKRYGRYDFVDVAWGLVFIVIAAVAFKLQPGIWFEWDLQVLVTALVIIWGGRLAWHIAQRIKSSHSEDPRYVELRKKWKGDLALNTYFRIYVVQAILALIISIPVIIINLSEENSVSALAWVGVAVWLIGFISEAVGDAQLKAFIRNPDNKGKLMTSGLWKYSRHPNYFGEITQWWGIFVICLTVPGGWLGVIGPLVITFLLLFVSGVPLSEKRFEGRPGWKEYRDRTSMLIPLPPKKS